MPPSIAESLARYETDYGMTPVVAAELEWYLYLAGSPEPAAASSLDTLLELLAEAAPKAGLALYSTDRERGRGQLEAALGPTRDPLALADDLLKLKALISALAEAIDCRAEFAAKPETHDFGSALQIHLHLEDAEGNNLFYKDGGRYSDALRFAIAGLLRDLPQDIACFVPTAESRARLQAGFHAPVNASWGANNRTTALRLPDGSGGLSGHAAIAARKPQPARRIEHRVAGADADPEQVIAAVLSGALSGLDARAEPPPAIHGDAALETLPPLV